jgi:hypothetical protein
LRHRYLITFSRVTFDYNRVFLGILPQFTGDTEHGKEACKETHENFSQTQESFQRGQRRKESGGSDFPSSIREEGDITLPLNGGLRERNGSKMGRFRKYPGFGLGTVIPSVYLQQQQQAPNPDPIYSPSDIPEDYPIYSQAQFGDFLGIHIAPIHIAPIRIGPIHLSDTGNFLANCAKTVGREIGKAEHTLTDAVGDIGHAIDQIPIVGGPLSSLFDASFHLVMEPTLMLASVASGQRIDRAILGTISDTVKSVKNSAQYVQMVVSFVPGIGTGIGAALGGGLALASGQPIDKALIATVSGAIPGGALAAAALNMADEGVRSAIDHTKLDLGGLASTAMGAAASILPVIGPAKDALMAGVNMAGQLAAGKPVDAALSQAAIAALPMDPSAKASLSDASGIASDLSHGKPLDGALLSHIGSIAGDLPLPDGVKQQLEKATKSGASVIPGVDAAKAMASTLASAVGNKLLNVGTKDLPPEVVHAIQIGMTTGNAVVQQNKRLDQLTHGLSGKLIQAGIDLAKANPTVAEARKLAGQGTRGFDTASGLVSQKATLFDITAMRNTFSGADQTGYDMAMALRNGLVAHPPASNLSEAGQASYAITKGIQGHNVQSKQAIVKVLGLHPSSSVGAVQAIKEIAAERDTWWHRILRALHLA